MSELIKIRKHCPKCEKIEYSKMMATPVQIDWLLSHPHHQENCPKCGHLGRESKIIDAKQIQKDFDLGQTPDFIARSRDITEAEVLKELTSQQRADYRRRLRYEYKKQREAEKKAKKLEAAKAKRQEARKRK